MQGVILTDDIFTSDLMNDAFPYRFFLGERLQQGEFPLWYPPVYGGFPLVARSESGLCYPPNLLLYGLVSPWTALNISILLTLLAAAWGLYLYARQMGSGASGSMAAGIAFAYGGFMVAHLKHLSMTATVSLFPFGLLFMEKALTAPTRRLMLRYAAGSGLVFGLQILAGHAQTAYYSALVYGAYAVARAANLRPHAAPRRGAPKEGHLRRFSAAILSPAVLLLLGALILGGALAAVQILPTYELVGLSQRAGGISLDYASGYAYDPADWVNLFWAYGRGDIGNATYRGTGIFWEDYGYAGATTMVLALLGLALNRRLWHVRFFAAAAAVSYLMVLGPATPLHEWAWRFVPGMEYFRFPTRFLFVVNAGLALLAAQGVKTLAERAARKGHSRSGIAGGVMAALVLGDLLLVQMRQNPVVDLDIWRTPPSTASILGRDTTHFRVFSTGGSETHKAAFAAARGWQGDLGPYIRQREFLQPGIHVLWGLSSPNGYAQLTPNQLVEIWGDQNRSGLILKTASLGGGEFLPGPLFLRLMNLFSVKYVVSPWPVKEPTYEPMEAPRGVFLYRNPAALPRAFLASVPLPAGSDAEAMRILTSEGFEPDREVILHDAAGAGARGEGGEVRIEEESANRIALSVRSERGGILVLSDTWYPGWRAESDGKPLRVLRANLCQRAVVLPPGEQRVEFLFESEPFRRGLILSGAASGILLGCMLFGFRRGK